MENIILTDFSNENNYNTNDYFIHCHKYPILKNNDNNNIKFQDTNTAFLSYKLIHPNFMIFSYCERDGIEYLGKNVNKYLWRLSLSSKYCNPLLCIIYTIILLNLSRISKMILMNIIQDVILMV